MKYSKIFYASLSLILTIIANFSCSESKKELPQESPANKIEIKVIFLKGSAHYVLDGKTVELAIGTSVPSKAVVSTEANSKCQIKFDTFGGISIDELTTISLSDIKLSTDKKIVTLELNKGSVLSTVSKLQGGQHFQVRTRSMTAGVRGTEFMVSATEDGVAKIAVQEGLVRIYPPNYNAETMDGSAQALMSENPEKKTLEALEYAGVQDIQAGFEGSVAVGELDTASKTIEKIYSILDESTEKLSLEEKIAKLKSAIDEYQSAIDATKITPAAPLSDSTKSVLDNLSNSNTETETPSPTPTISPTPISSSISPTPSQEPVKENAKKPSWIKSQTNGWIVFGKKMVGNGLGMITESGEGRMSATQIQGKDALISSGLSEVNAEWPQYFYFDVQSTKIRNGNAKKVKVTIEYLDRANSSPPPNIILEYDSNSLDSENKPQGFKPDLSGLFLYNTDKWLKKIWILDDTGFNGNTNGHDFRLRIPAGVKFIISAASVEAL